MTEIKAKRLKPHENITSVKLGCYYVAYKKDNHYALSDSVKVNFAKKEVSSEDEGEPANNELLVRVKKIIPPDIVEVEAIDLDYVVELDYPLIGSFKLTDVGRKETIIGRVEDIIQTSGPTLFSLFDGSGVLTLKSFAGPGIRAFPNISKGDYVKAKVLLKSREGVLEAEVLSMSRLDAREAKSLASKLDKIFNEQAKPKNVQFMVDSEILRSLKPRMHKSATLIRTSIIEGRPIILRHHADCDGYSGAVALERAILPLIVKYGNDVGAQWRLYRRAPTKTPYYDYADVTKDISSAIEDTARFGKKDPLIILVDHGSSGQNLLAIKKLRIFGAKVIVIDHHFPGEIKDGKALIDDFVDAHVNPFIVGGDSNLTAGMLGVEIARMINPNVKQIEFLAALSGIGDKSECNEFEEYKKIAANAGYSYEFLQKLSKVIDFESHYLRFIESRGLVDDLLGAKQQELVELLTPDITSREKAGLNAALHYLSKKELNGCLIASYKVEEVCEHNDYPPPGKLSGLVFDYFKNSYKSVIVLGIGDNFITMRATDTLNIHALMDFLKQKLPYANIDGGGHERAGTIRFIKAAQEEVIALTNSFLEQLLAN